MIDAHQHVWDRDTVPQPWIDPVSMAPIARSFGLDEAREEAAALGVHRAVLVQTVPGPHETPLLLAAAARDGYVAGVVGWVDLQGPDVARHLDALRSGPGGDRLVGVRHLVQDEPDPEWLDRPAVRAGLRAVAAAGLAYDLLIRPAQYEAAARLVRELPDLRVVLDHLGKPPIVDGDLSAWADLIRALAACPNVTAKLSGLVTEASWSAWTPTDLLPCVDLALRAFGPTRLAFGSDWPVCRLAAGGYPRWWAALRELLKPLRPDERAAIYGGTASTAYNLKP